MVPKDTVFVKHPDVACRLVDGRAVAVNTAPLGQPPSLLTFNETGTAIWELLDGRQDVGAVLARLAERYPDTPADRRQTETLTFLEQLATAGLVVTQERPVS